MTACVMYYPFPTKAVPRSSFSEWAQYPYDGRDRSTGGIGNRKRNMEMAEMWLLSDALGVDMAAPVYVSMEEPQRKRRCCGLLEIEDIDVDSDEDNEALEEDEDEVVESEEEYDEDDEGSKFEEIEISSHSDDDVHSDNSSVEDGSDSEENEWHDTDASSVDGDDEDDVVYLLLDDDDSEEEEGECGESDDESDDDDSEGSWNAREHDRRHKTCEFGGRRRNRAMEMGEYERGRDNDERAEEFDDDEASVIEEDFSGSHDDEDDEDDISTIEDDIQGEEDELDEEDEGESESEQEVWN